MKKFILLIISIVFALTLSSCQLSTAADKDAVSKAASDSSISIQTEAVSKEKAFEQTETVDEDDLANATDKEVNFEEIYNKFLSGQIAAVDKEGYITDKGGTISIDYYSDPDYIQKYAIYDMNGDKIPELIINSRIGLDIFWIYNNELTLWHSDVNYVKPLNNMALLYERPGGAPEHTYYKYIALGYQGEERYKIEFAEYYNWYVDGVDCGAKYFIDDIEVTKGIYDGLTKRYLNIGDDKIEWKTFSY